MKIAVIGIGKEVDESEVLICTGNPQDIFIVNITDDLPTTGDDLSVIVAQTASKYKTAQLNFLSPDVIYNPTKMSGIYRAADMLHHMWPQGCLNKPIFLYFGPRVYPKGSLVIALVRVCVRPSLNISETAH